MRLISMICCGTALCGLALAMLSDIAFAQETVIEIQLGHSNVIRPSRAPDIVIVGDSTVADATVIADRSVLVTGRSVGQTNLILADEGGEVTFTAIVEVLRVDRRPQTVIRVIEGGRSEDGAIYVCGPEPGCRLHGEGASPIIESVRQADPTVLLDIIDQSGDSE